MRLVVPPELWPLEQALESWAEQEPSIARIWLYGSRITARARPDSDIDVAIALLAPCDEAAYARTLQRFRRRVQAMTKLHVDLRIAESGQAGVDALVTAVQRTGPIVRAVAETIAGRARLAIELPHLHHDVPQFRAGATVRLRLMQFSVYARGERVELPNAVEAPVLIGRERERESDSAAR